MSELERLIQELCPNGVEYKTIKETVGVNRGKRLTKNQLDDNAKYEVYHGSKDSILGKYNNYNAPANTTIVVNTGGIGGVKFIDKPFWCSDGSFWLGQVEYINEKYLYYSISGYEDYFYSQKRVGGVPTIDRGVVENFKIPVPPIEVQHEIVRILDNFTELSTELSMELTARKKQYEYYLDQFYGKAYDEMLLLGKKDGYKILPLAEIGNIIRGKRFVKADSEGLTDGVPCIHYGELYTHYGVSAQKSKSFVPYELAKKLRFAHKNDVVIVGAGENNIDIGVGVAWFGDDVAVHDACYILKHNLNPKYISYYLRTSIYHNQIKKYVSEGKICSISAQGLGKALVPVPPLEEQERIVAILDRFDALCNDISAGLPAEIEARQKQYEYYRDKLLTFQEMSV